MRAASVVFGAALLAHPVWALDLADIQRRGTLRVLVVQSSDPSIFFSFAAPAGKPGFDREILEGFVRLHRVSLEAVPVPSWDALIPALLEGRGDCIAGGVSNTQQRAAFISFTESVFPSRHVVVTRKPHLVVRTLEELRRERIGAVKGTRMVDILAEAQVPPSAIDNAIASGGLPAALRSGRITAYAIGIERAITHQRDDPDLQIGMALGGSEHLAWGVRKTDPELLAALNEFLGNFRRAASWNRLIVKYFGDGVLPILQTARPE